MAVMLVAGGCALLGSGQCLRDPLDVEAARQCFVRGDYRCTADTVERFLATGAGQPGYDKALHLAAMNCMFLGAAAPGYARSRDYLQRLVEECPASPLLPEAALWISLLNDLERHSESDAGARQILEDRMRSIQTLEKLIKACVAERDAGQREIGRLRQEVTTLQNNIKELEKVDVQFFQRKRDFGDDTE